jgi:hypothetical protein
MKNKLSIIMSALLLVLTSKAFAAQDPAMCELIGSLASGIAVDRNHGVTYNAELGKVKGALQDMPSGKTRNDLLAISKSALKTVYLDMPKITPDGAYKYYYVVCMDAK